MTWNLKKTKKTRRNLVRRRISKKANTWLSRFLVKFRCNLTWKIIIMKKHRRCLSFLVGPSLRNPSLLLVIIRFHPFSAVFRSSFVGFCRFLPPFDFVSFSLDRNRFFSFSYGETRGGRELSRSGVANLDSFPLKSILSTFFF